MSIEHAETLASQIVRMLSGLDASTIQAHEGLRNAVLDLIERSGTGFRDEVTTRLRARKRPRKNKDDSCQREGQIARYFAEQAYSGPANNVRTVAQLTKALNGLRSSLKTPIDMYRATANEDARQSPGEAPLIKKVASRQKRVMQQFRTCDRKTNVTEGLRRLCLLRVIYEVDRLLDTTEREESDKSDIAAAERAFSRLSGESSQAIRDLRNIGSSYLTVANRENGLGFLLMLGCQTRDIWEQRLKGDAVDRLWKFCDAYDRSVTDRAKELQPIACKLILQSFSDNDTHPSELRLAGHVFSRHFKEHEDSQSSPAGSHVATADQVQADHPELDADFPQPHQAGQMRAQQQFSGATLDMTTMNQQVYEQPVLPQWQSSTRSCYQREKSARTAFSGLSSGRNDDRHSTIGQAASQGLDSGVTLDFSVHHDSVIIGPAQESALQQVGNEPTTHPPPYAKSSVVQEIADQRAPFDSDMNPPLDQHGQDGMTNGATIVDSTDSTDWEWNYGIWSSEWLNNPL